MPQYKRPFDKGNLYIRFKVEFPPDNWIALDEIEVLNFLRDDIEGDVDSISTPASAPRKSACIAKKKE